LCCTDVHAFSFERKPPHSPPKKAIAKITLHLGVFSLPLMVKQENGLIDTDNRVLLQNNVVPYLSLKSFVWSGVFDQMKGSRSVDAASCKALTVEMRRSPTVLETAAWPPVYRTISL